MVSTHPSERKRHAARPRTRAVPGRLARARTPQKWRCRTQAQQQTATADRQSAGALRESLGVLFLSVQEVNPGFFNAEPFLRSRRGARTTPDLPHTTGSVCTEIRPRTARTHLPNPLLFSRSTRFLSSPAGCPSQRSRRPHSLKRMVARVKKGEGVEGERAAWGSARRGALQRQPAGALNPRQRVRNIHTPTTPARAQHQKFWTSVKTTSHVVKRPALRSGRTETKISKEQD